MRKTASQFRRKINGSDMMRYLKVKGATIRFNNVTFLRPASVGIYIGEVWVGVIDIPEIQKCSVNGDTFYL